MSYPSMEFTEYIKDNDKQKMAVRSRTQPTPHLVDPILRRYHIVRLSGHSLGLAMGAWSMRLLAENM